MATPNRHTMKTRTLKLKIAYKPSLGALGGKGKAGGRRPSGEDVKDDLSLACEETLS